MAGAVRGLGKTTAIMVANLGATIGARQLYLFIMANYISNDYVSIIFAIPLGIILYGVTMAACYLYHARRGNLGAR